jgi:hypothetical protein
MASLAKRAVDAIVVKVNEASGWARSSGNSASGPTARAEIFQAI